MKMIEVAKMPQMRHAKILPQPQAESACRRRHKEGVKKLKMANCRSCIFNGLGHPQSPVFEFFHTSKPMSAPPGVPSVFDSLEVKVLHPIPPCGMKG
jgi:hypothetical protein